MPAESIKKKKIRMKNILDILKNEYPDSKCSLNYKNPFQLLVATILSAQCTDDRVNKVTSGLFARYPNVEDMEKLSRSVLAKEIYSTGFFNNKSNFW